MPDLMPNSLFVSMPAKNENWSVFDELMKL